MANKKRAGSGNREDQRPAVGPSAMTVMSIKMTVGFRDWIAGLADSERITNVQLVEKALVEFAERKKYDKAAPRRTEGR